MTQGERLARFSRLVRGSSMKRFRRVRPEDRGWRPALGRLSFVDHLKHLVDCDRWILAVAQDRDEPMADIRPGEGDVSFWDEYMADLERLGDEKASFFGRLDDRQMDRVLDKPDGIRGTEVGTLILRHNLDHEIHHRGALNLLLLLKYPEN